MLPAIILLTDAMQREKAQKSAQVLLKSPLITGENRVFATTVGPQEALTVAKILSGSAGSPVKRAIQLQTAAVLSKIVQVGGPRLSAASAV